LIWEVGLARKRRSFNELFVDKLKELSGGEQKLIGNGSLREALKWDEERYKRIKSQLLEENLIIAGRGYGGSVGLADVPGSKALSLFISYSHADEGIKTELLKHIAPLKRLNLVDAWHDRKLKAGEEWEQAIAKELENADIILLLVSIDFINSKYCYDIELDKALERHSEKKAIVIPVIARNCLWQHTPFSKLQALPKDAKAIASWPDQDEALTNVVEGVRIVAEQLRTSK
jgi:hypothetical protein